MTGYLKIKRIRKPKRDKLSGPFFYPRPLHCEMMVRFCLQLDLTRCLRNPFMVDFVLSPCLVTCIVNDLKLVDLGT